MLVRQQYNFDASQEGVLSWRFSSFSINLPMWILIMSKNKKRVTIQLTCLSLGYRQVTVSPTSYE